MLVPTIGDADSTANKLWKNWTGYVHPFRSLDDVIEFRADVLSYVELLEPSYDLKGEADALHARV